MPPRANSPRYPLVIAEVDESIPALARSTVTPIDDRRTAPLCAGDRGDALFDLVQDRQRIFAARVVRGEVELVSRLGGTAPHAEPLALIAVAAHLAGIAASRWLFFAEARHVVTLFYGRSV